MRAVFVNLSHPDTPHVSGVRVPSFACAMARRGHRIVLLTRSLDDRDPGDTPRTVAQALETHDWAAPLQVSVRPARAPLLASLRAGALPRLASKALTAWSFVRHGGVYWDWSKAAREVEEVIAGRFRPEVVWASFLPTDTLVVAQRLARLAGCPWHIDLKDAWSHRLPAGLRAMIARRFGDAAGLTANSLFHARIGEVWFEKQATPLRDGISPEFFEGKVDRPGAAFALVLVGSTYGEKPLASFLEGVKGWLLSLPAEKRKPFTFAYVGSDSRIVTEACARVGLPETRCHVQIRGYVPIAELAATCRSASCNAYIWLPTTAHKKLPELLACGRPVIAYPGEQEEAFDLARELGGKLFVCRSDADLRAALDAAASEEFKGRLFRDEGKLRELTWDAQAGVLERCLVGSLSGGASVFPATFARDRAHRTA